MIQLMVKRFLMIPNAWNVVNNYNSEMSCEEHEKFPLYLARRDRIYCTYIISGRGQAILENAERYFQERTLAFMDSKVLCQIDWSLDRL